MSENTGIVSLKANYTNMSVHKHLPLTTSQFYIKHLTTGLIGEVIFRTFRWDENVSLSLATKKLDDLTGFGGWIRSWGANAEKVDVEPTVVEPTIVKEVVKQTVVEPNTVKEAVNQTAGTAANVSSTWNEYVPGPIKAAYNGTCDLTSRTLSGCSDYATRNSDWLLLTGGIAVSAAAINHFLTKKGKIENESLRNIVSVVGGSAVVLGAHLALSYTEYSNPAEFSKTVDIGARLLLTHWVFKQATPFAQWSMDRIVRVIEPLNAKFAYPLVKQKSQ
ncbi:MAG: hypothetical protein K1000chlam3_00629 [Chlamydiae bacterium]|nr:hypothetical protein [Chlamydiota bacterium]